MRAYDVSHARARIHLNMYMIIYLELAESRIIEALHVRRTRRAWVRVFQAAAAAARGRECAEKLTGEIVMKICAYAHV